MRILALDVGDRRVGVAVSDESGLIARPLTTIQRRSKAEDFSRIMRLAREQGVDGLVIGSELFLQETIAAHAHILRRRSDFTQARGPDEAPLGLCCYKRLRAL